jgi:hypothetical protein
MIDVEALGAKADLCFAPYGIGGELHATWQEDHDLRPYLQKFAALVLEAAARAAESPECGPDSTQRKITAQAIRALKPSQALYNNFSKVV